MSRKLYSNKLLFVLVLTLSAQALFGQYEQDSISVLVKTRTYVTNKVHTSRFKVRIVGSLAGVVNDTLHVISEKHIYPVAVPLEAIEVIKASNGEKSRMLV